MKIVVKVIRTIIKYIEVLIMRYVVVPVVTWVRMWIDNGLPKPSRNNKNNGNGPKAKSKAKSKNPGNKKPDKQKETKKPERPDTGKNPDPGKGNRGPKEPRKNETEGQGPKTDREKTDELMEKFPDLRQGRVDPWKEAYAETRAPWEGRWDPKDIGWSMPMWAGPVIQCTLRGLAGLVIIYTILHFMGWLG